MENTINSDETNVVATPLGGKPFDYTSRDNPHQSKIGDKKGAAFRAARLAPTLSESGAER